MEALQEEVIFYKEQLSSFKDMMKRTVSYMEEIEQELHKKNTEINQSISYAEKVQKNLLPNSLILKKFFSELSYHIKQRNSIGGDMIFVQEFQDVVCFGLMDCTGHGIPGALISMIGHTSITNSLKESNKLDPAGILNEVNLKFQNFFSQSDQESFLNDSMDGILCSYNHKTKELIYCTAGRPIWIKRDKWEIIKSEKISIGGVQKEDYRNHKIQLKPNNELFICSDGVFDQFGGPKNKKFMSKRVLSILNSSDKESLNKRTLHLINDLKGWQGNYEQTDDISFLALKL